MKQKQKLKWYYWIPVLGSLGMFYIPKEADWVLDTLYYEYQIICMLTAAFLLCTLMISLHYSYHF